MNHRAHTIPMTTGTGYGAAVDWASCAIAVRSGVRFASIDGVKPLRSAVGLAPGDTPAT